MIRTYVGRGGQRCRLGADGQGRVFGRKQPGNGEQTDGEEEVEHEQHDGGDDTGGLAAIGDGAGEDGHAAGLADDSEEHKLTAAEAVENPDDGDGGEAIGRRVSDLLHVAGFERRLRSSNSRLQGSKLTSKQFR